MDLLSILGLACVNAQFRQALYDRGAGALQGSGIPVLLSQEDSDTLQQFQGDQSLLDGFGRVNELVCRVPPCPKKLKYPLPGPTSA